MISGSTPRFACHHPAFPSIFSPPTTQPHNFIQELTLIIPPQSQIHPQIPTMVAQTPAFKKAVEDSRKLKAKPNNDELLEVNPLSLSPSLPSYSFHCSQKYHILIRSFLASSCTHTTNKARAKTSPRPRSPAPLRFRFEPLSHPIQTNPFSLPRLLLLRSMAARSQASLG